MAIDVVSSISRLVYVYYLYDRNGGLMWVGRSFNPRARLTALQRKHKTEFELVIGKGTHNFAKAQDLERREIVSKNPKLNKLIASSPGMLDKVHTKSSRDKMSVSKKLHPMSKEGRAGVAAANLGKHHTKRSRALLRAAFKDIPLSAEHRAKIGAANTGPLHYLYGKERSAIANARTGAGVRAYYKNKKLFLFEEMMGSLYVLRGKARVAHLYTADRVHTA
jgi:hypothetical protein